MLRVVLPFCKKDVKQMGDLLRWAIELDGRVNHNCVLSYEDGTDPSEIRDLAARYFTGNIIENIYSPPPVPGWPAACNWAWQSMARFMDDKKINEPWFWWESDAVPLNPGWLDKIYEGYLKGGKRFAGHIVNVMGHMNGVGIYPPDVRRRCNEAMLCRSAAWDYVLKDTITGDCANLNHLIQHVWNIKNEDGSIWNGDGRVVSFPDWPSVEKWMNFNCVLLHRTKDGTLIERLRERREWERNKIEAETISVETNVPNFTVNAIETPRIKQRIGPVEIMIVTYFKDLPWLELCMKCLRKHVTGFAGITVCVPNRDKKLFRSLMIQYGFNMYGYDEVEGKGMLQHMAVMALADEIVPKKARFVAHIDSDTMYKMGTTPDDYFVDGKPIYMIRTYDSLKDSNGVVSDCYQWKPVTEAQLGTSVNWYTMCAFPFIYPVEFYAAYRKRIEKVHGKPFIDYMLEGKNSFPQTRVDFQAMGAFCREAFRDKFHWIDVEIEPARIDRHKPYWSHAGVRPEILKEIESFYAS